MTNQIGGTVWTEAREILHERLGVALDPSKLGEARQLADRTIRRLIDRELQQMRNEELFAQTNGPDSTESGDLLARTPYQDRGPASFS